MLIDPSQGARQSINSSTINVGGPDPIQGYDVGVFVQDSGRGHKDILLGQFTSIQIRVIVAAEPYKCVGYEIPVYLDGEKQITFVLDKGLLDVNVFRETFGFKTYSWLNRYIRSPRFKITFAIDPVDFAVMDEVTKAYGQQIQRTPSGRFVLEMAKVNEWGIGSEGGKKVVVTQWQGVAQQIWAEPLTLNNMPGGKRAAYDSAGRPVDPIELPTFFFADYADYASTTPRVVPTSYQLYPDWISPEMILQAEKTILLNLPDFPGRQALLDSIDRQLAAVISSSDPRSFELLTLATFLFPERKSSAINEIDMTSESAALNQMIAGFGISRQAVDQATRAGLINEAIGDALMRTIEGRIVELTRMGIDSYAVNPVNEPRNIFGSRDAGRGHRSRNTNSVSEPLKIFGGKQGRKSASDNTPELAKNPPATNPPTPPSKTGTQVFRTFEDPKSYSKPQE